MERLRTQDLIAVGADAKRQHRIDGVKLGMAPCTSNASSAMSRLHGFVCAGPDSRFYRALQLNLTLERNFGMVILGTGWHF